MPRARHAHLLAGSAAALTLMTAPTAARADKFDTTLDVSLGSRASWIDVDQAMKPPPLGDGVGAIEATQPRLVGNGYLVGGLLRGGLTLDGIHFGFGMGVTGAGNLSFVHLPAADGLHVAPGKIWGMPVEAFAGYTFGDAREIRGFVELRGGITIVQTRVELEHPGLGHLGHHPFNAYLYALELRAGVRIPLSDEFFLHAGVGGSPIGAERLSGSLALGLPIPLDNL